MLKARKAMVESHLAAACNTSKYDQGGEDHLYYSDPNMVEDEDSSMAYNTMDQDTESQVQEIHKMHSQTSLLGDVQPSETNSMTYDRVIT
jgi:uncharacterized protein involved in tolerance to divalent cations